MSTFEDRANEFLRTLQVLFQIKGGAAAKVVADADAALLNTGWDRWDGGIDLFTFELITPARTFAEIEPVQDEVEAELKEQLRKLTRTEAGVAITDVVIRPAPPDIADVNGEAEPSLWTPGFFRLFLSHHSSQKIGVEKLRDALRPYYISGFVAHADIEPTRQWESQIEAALRTMDALVAVINEHFRGSAWCDQEVGYAMGRNRLVIPLRAGADPYGFLGKFQGLQAKSTRSDILAERIFGIVAKHETSRRRIAEVMVQQLLDVSSWEDARAVVGLLERIPTIDRDLLDRLRDGWQGNEKIVEAYTVPNRITALTG